MRVPAFIGLVIAGLTVGVATVEVPFGAVPEEFTAALGETFIDIGDYIARAFADVDIPLLVAGWIIAATIRIAQGSATVAVLTTAGIVVALVPGLTVHPVYLVLISGVGGNVLSWSTDSGFWIVEEIGGLTRTETL
ncbi:GntT/GntP/DsdX family permease [Halalkalicoccus ordinarius]|uniref:GntT/GntP/DsdX family permease n=1 Tax=Halalkalicoccus ordinarius TaxID=3116651 RepID=UPI00300E9A07